MSPQISYQQIQCSPKRQRLGALLIMVAVAAIVAGGSLSLPLDFSPVAAQRLCENSDSAAATISPCTGPVGTTINLTLKRKLASPPQTMVFKRVLANGVPARVTTAITNLSATAPAQLCTSGDGRWQVWLVDARGRSQGVIGAYWPDCRGTNGGNGNAAGGPGPRGNAGPQPIATPVVLPPVTMNVDNAQYVRTNGTGQSEIRDITSHDPGVATAREWGTNEVQINARRPGVTTIRFWDRSSGLYYEVVVTVNPKPPPGGGGAGANKPPGPKTIDKCLVGTWRSVSGRLTHITSGGSGVLLTIKTDGTTAIDYSGMTEMKDTSPGRETNSVSITGKAGGRISTNDRKIAVESVENSALSQTQTDSTGTRTTKPSSLGWVFYGRGKPPSPWIINYTCDEASLTVKSEASGLAVSTFVFKKEK